MTVFDFTAQDLGGTERSLADWRGNVLLIVNVASKCGFTPQYAGLEELYRRHKDRGLVVLGFPCDQFGHQEPGDEAAIRDFCEVNYGVTFPMFAKVDVNGPDDPPALPPPQAGTEGRPGLQSIKWNFTKFLVGPGRRGPRPLCTDRDAGAARAGHRVAPRRLSPAQPYIFSTTFSQWSCFFPNIA
jgi:glutathione peroxidase